MSEYFGRDNGALEECFMKRYGSPPEGGGRVYLLLRRDRLAEDGRRRCVAVTEDPRVAEQWRTGGRPEDGRSWEAVGRFQTIEAVLDAVGE